MSAPPPAAPFSRPPEPSAPSRPSRCRWPSSRRRRPENTPTLSLLRLGADFEREHVILASLKNEEDRLNSVFEAEKERRGTRGWDALTALHEEVGAKEAVSQASDQFDKLDAITSVIRSIPARTLDGLAVKVRATAYDCHFSLSFDLPPDQIDWQEGCFLQLVREVERMAKVAAHV